MGLVNLFSAVTPALQERLRLIETIFPLQVRSGTRLATALAGFTLILLASGIWRGKKAAWWVTVSVLVVSSIGHLVKGFDFEEASLAAALLLGLVLYRQRFQAGSDAPTVARGLKTLALAFAFTLLYGAAGFYLLDRHFAVRYNLWQAAYQTVQMFISFNSPAMAATTRFGRYFVDSIYLVGIATTGYALLALLAPVLLRQMPGPDEKERAKGIVERYGPTVLARFCLLPDKRYFFSPGGTLISYAFSGRTAVVLGDPCGPEEDARSALQAFHEFCYHNDWLITFYQTRPDLLPIYRDVGMQALKIGEEALVDCVNFSLKGPDMKPIRNAASKLERMGYTCNTSHPPHSAQLLAELKQI
jgi:phosphatidylglycerol lysyltransferase